MRRWSSRWLPCLLVLLAPAAAMAQDRIFEIVPPAGNEVQMVDGYTVLRQPGKQYGAVLTYMPESESTAWIPVAVLNTSGGPLKVGTKGVSARSGGAGLKVWSTTALLVRLAKEGSISAPPAMVEAAARPGNPDLEKNDAPVAPREPDRIGPFQPSQQSQTLGRTNNRANRNNAQERERDLAAAQVTALRERLFRDQTIEAREVGRGDVRINLPPRRGDGEPAEFVLTLDFGGETMAVTYRERVVQEARAGDAP